MIEEYQIIPFETCTLSGENWLVFAPHADDETIGMGGTLLDASLRGINLNLIVVTDGAFVNNDKQELIDTRINEALDAASFLGINKVVFLGEKDRQLSINDQSIDNICEQIKIIKPDVIFIPSALEFHPDHRMTAELVWHALKKSAYKKDLFSYEISVQSPVSHLIDITTFEQNKRKAIAIYASQISQNNYIDIALALNKLRSYTLPATVEYVEGFKQLELDKFDTFSDSTLDALSLFLDVQEMADMQQQNSTLKLELDKVKKSTSWRITKPLRAIKNFF